MVQQIVFYWSEQTLTGGRGVGPVASSIHGSALSTWQARLRPYVWAANVPDDMVHPGRDLVYVLFDSEAALLHRMRAPDPGGRPSTLTHCLVGAATDLDPHRALGLHAWGWTTDAATMPSDGTLGAVGAAQLHRAAQSGLDELRQDARHADAAVFAGLIDHLLADPTSRLSVVEPPVTGTQLMCALLDMVGRALEGPITYATRIETDTNSGGPQVVVLERPPTTTMHSVQYRRLRPGMPAGTGESAAFSRLLAVTYVHAGPDGVAALWPETRLRTSDEVTAWISSIRLAPEVFGTPLSVLRRVTDGYASAADRAWLASDEGGRLLTAAVAQLPNTRLAALVRSSSGSALPPDVQHLVHQEAVRRCLRSASENKGELLRTTREAGPEPALVADTLENVWRAVRKDRPTEALILNLLGDALYLGLPLDPQPRAVTAMVAALGPYGLIDAAAEHAEFQPAFALRLLYAVAAYKRLKHDRARLERLLADRRYLVDTVEAIAAGGVAAAADMYPLVLRTAFRTPIDDAHVAYRVLRQVGRPVPTALATALFAATEPASPAYHYLVRELRPRAREADHRLALPAGPSADQAGVDAPPASAQIAHPPTERLDAPARTGNFDQPTLVIVCAMVLVTALLLYAIVLALGE